MGTTVWNGMLGLLLPRGCAGCDKPDEVLCPDCQALFRKHVTLPLGGSSTGTVAGTGAGTGTAARAAVPPVAITAGGVYQGRVRRAILSWKDHGDAECDKAFAQICRELARETVTSSVAKRGMPDAGAVGVGAADGAISMGTAYEDAASMNAASMNVTSTGSAGMKTTGMNATGMGVAGNGATGNATPTPILVVPAPSSSQSMRARGRRHLWPLAKAIASELAYGGAESCAVNALGISRVHDKAVETNNASGRAARLKERLEVADPGLITGKSVLILDDIVTTGTTMRRCAEAIRGAGGQVIGGIALAAVPPPDELQEDTPC